MIDCGRCGVRNSDELYFCKACGTRLVSSEVLPDDRKQAGIDELRSVVEKLVSARQAEAAPLGAPAPVAFLPARLAAPATSFRLVSINADGSDGQAHLLGAGPVDIGRSAGNLVFDDPFLASRHARIAATAEGHMLQPLEKRNGVFRRLRGPAELAGGDKLLIGKQLLLFEVMPELERVAPASLENGLCVFGSRAKPAWGRLYQLTPAGVPRDVYHLDRSETVIGRERTDLVFSDDELLSTRHAKVTLHAGRVYVEDLGSLNGTFVSLREPYVLGSGDVFRMGNEVFRFEAA